MKEKVLCTVFNGNSSKYTIDFKSDQLECSKMTKLSTIMFFDYAPNSTKSV